MTSQPFLTGIMLITRIGLIISCHSDVFFLAFRCEVVAPITVGANFAPGETFFLSIFMAAATEMAITNEFLLETSFCPRCNFTSLFSRIVYFDLVYLGIHFLYLIVRTQQEDYKGKLLFIQSQEHNYKGTTVMSHNYNN